MPHGFAEVTRISSTNSGRPLAAGVTETRGRIACPVAQSVSQNPDDASGLGLAVQRERVMRIARRAARPLWWAVFEELASGHRVTVTVAALVGSCNPIATE